MALPAVEPSEKSATRLRVRYSNGHGSRYNLLNRAAMPPSLKEVRRLLVDLARRHRQFPGVGIEPRGLLNQVASAVRQKRGSSDDIIRALKNAGILVEVELASGETLLAYDDERLQQAIAFSSGDSKTFDAVDSEFVEVRIFALLANAGFEDESAPESSEGMKQPDATPPEFEIALITLDDAKKTVSFEGGGSVPNLVVQPTGILATAYPHCPREGLVALVEKAVTLGFLREVGPATFSICLTPVPPAPANANDAPSLSTHLENRRTALRVHLAAVERALLEKTEQLVAKRAAQLEAIAIRYTRVESADCDQIRERAERANAQRRSEIFATRDKRLAMLDAAYARRRERIMAAAEQRAQSEADALGADADQQMDKVKGQHAQAHAQERDAAIAELERTDHVALQPLQDQTVDLRDRIAQCERLLADCMRPLP